MGWWDDLRDIADDFDLDDVFRTVGIGREWKKDRDLERTQAAWNKYQRAVDVASLRNVDQQLGHRLATIAESGLTTRARAALLDERARGSQLLAEYMGRSARAEYLESKARTQSDYELAVAQLDTRGLQISRDRALLTRSAVELTVAKRTMELEWGASRAVLDARSNQLMVQRGVFTENQAAELGLIQQARRVVDLERGTAVALGRSRQDAIDAKVDVLNSEIEQFDYGIALQRSQIREGAAMARGAAAAAGASRGRGSFEVTEAARVGRDETRALGRVFQAEQVARGRFAVAGLELAGAALENRLGLRGTLAALEGRELGLDRDVTALRGRTEEFLAGASVAERGIAADRAGLEGARARGRASFETRGVDIKHRRGLLGSAGRELAAQRRAAGLARDRGLAEAERGLTEGMFDRQQQNYQTAEYHTSARETRAQARKLAREHVETKNLRDLTQWQRDQLPKLPAGVNPRSAVDLILSLTANELADED